MWSRIFKERTTWDGFVILGVCGAIILFGGLAEMAAWGGVVYALWTILKEEK